ncbi:MAG: polysaccharide deacetylase family protein [Halodesulfurarchaeum sp.]
MTDRPAAVLSVDFELFSHTPAYRNAEGSLSDPDVGLSGAEFLQEAFESAGVKSTWFTVGEVAEDHPGALEELPESGHEIASHTRSHRLLSELDGAERAEEFEQSKAILETITGARVTGFRAPAFDFGDGHFEALEKSGYDYDSSVIASRSIPGWYGGEYELTSPAPATAVQPDAPEQVAELPVSVMPGLRLPLTGTWLRFFGPRYTILGMRRLANRGIAPILYVHPWELVELPRIEGVPKRVYWHTGNWMRRAIERILDTNFEFRTARSVLESSDMANEPHRGNPRERPDR